ncbi:BCCT, betaine/carnitine/choline family transporter, partial [Idiomarina aquatica]
TPWYACERNGALTPSWGKGEFTLNNDLINKADSMSYSIAMVGAGHDEPHAAVRVFWGGAMAIMAAVLLYMGAGQISVLQQFIVITALPVSLVILPTLWTGPQTAKAMYRQQFGDSD